MSLALEIFKSPIKSWHYDSNHQNRLEILLENPLPFTPVNFHLECDRHFDVPLEHGTFRLSYYGQLVTYYLQLPSGILPYASQDWVVNKYANENLKDVWINGIRWGINADTVKTLLTENQKAFYGGENRCPDCGLPLPWEELMQFGYCSGCLKRQKDLKMPIYFNAKQKIYIAEQSLYRIESNKVYTDSHVVIRDTWGKKARREVVRGHIYRHEHLIEVK